MDGARTKIQMHNNYRNSMNTKLNHVPKWRVFAYFKKYDNPTRNNLIRQANERQPWFRNMSDELQDLMKQKKTEFDNNPNLFKNKTSSCDGRENDENNVIRNKDTEWIVDGTGNKNEWIYCQIHPEECEGPGCGNQKKQ